KTMPARPTRNAKHTRPAQRRRTARQNETEGGDVSPTVARKDVFQASGPRSDRPRTEVQDTVPSSFPRAVTVLRPVRALVTRTLWAILLAPPIVMACHRGKKDGQRDASTDAGAVTFDSGLAETVVIYLEAGAEGPARSRTVTLLSGLPTPCLDVTKRL